MLDDNLRFIQTESILAYFKEKYKNKFAAASFYWELYLIIDIL
jgi:hypothetical protein